MRLLLDTCTFLWMIAEPERLSARAREAVVDPASDIFLSAASAWEIALKHRLGKLPLPSPPERFVPAMRERHGIEPLPVGEAATLHTTKLPDLHRDPFDRLLVAQAIVDGLTVLTPDEAIRGYPAPSLW